MHQPRSGCPAVRPIIGYAAEDPRQRLHNNQSGRLRDAWGGTWRKTLADDRALPSFTGMTYPIGRLGPSTISRPRKYSSAWDSSRYARAIFEPTLTPAWYLILGTPDPCQSAPGVTHGSHLLPVVARHITPHLLPPWSTSRARSPSFILITAPLDHATPLGMALVFSVLLLQPCS